MKTALLWLLLALPSPAPGGKATPVTTADSINLQSISGTAVHLSDAPFAGKVLLVVNTASECGFTPQYAGLENLYTKYRDKGLVVLGFPSNDFGGQEPGSNAEIQQFCSSKFHVDFPPFAKGPVKGSSKQPLYTWLIEHSDDKADPSWNFEKFLLGRDHKVVARFKSSVEPESGELTSAIEKALKN